MINSITGIDYEQFYSYAIQNNNNIDNSVINSYAEKIQQEAADDASEVTNTTQNTDQTNTSNETGEAEETEETEEEPISQQRLYAQKVIKVFMADISFSKRYKSAMAKCGIKVNEDGSFDKTALLEGIRKTITDTLNNSSFAKKYNNFIKRMTGEDTTTDVETNEDDENDVTSSENINDTIQKNKELLSNSKYSDAYQAAVNKLKNNTSSSENTVSESLKDYKETNIVDLSDIDTSVNSQFSYLGDEVLSLQDELQSHVNTADSVKTYDDVEEYIDYYTNLYNQIIDKKEEYDKAVDANS